MHTPHRTRLPADLPGFLTRTVTACVLAIVAGAAGAVRADQAADPKASPPAATAPEPPAAPSTAPPAELAPSTPPARQPEDGFVALFDGTTLNGWIGDTSGYVVEDGAIACTATGRNIFTAKEYGDFTLRLEFMLTPGANNGIGLRAPTDGDAAYEGIEVQVLDDAHSKYASIKSWQAHGSVYGIVPAKRGALKPAGEWNEQEIDLQGSRIRVTLNGTVIVDADLYRQAHDGTLDGQPHPGLRRTSGHIGFLGHGDRVLFRKIRIKEVQ